MRAGRLLTNRDFRRLYLAGAISDFGGALHYIALMWFALELGGPLGVIAVRLADGLPAFAFGLYGGAAADRFAHRALLVSGDLVRGVALLPLALASLTGHLALWQLVVAAFVLETASSWFLPAEGALLPSLVDRGELQRANGLIRATAQAVGIGGWAAAAWLVAILPMGAFFAFNALSFFVSALFLIRLPSGRKRERAERPNIRGGIQAVAAQRGLAIAVGVLGVAGTVTSGSWIGGLPQLVRDDLSAGAAGFSITMIGYAAGALGVAVLLARVEVRNKARASVLYWALALPGFVLLALASRLPVAVAGAALIGAGAAAARVLLTAAAQAQTPADTLGRVMGLLSLIDRGSHATGLLLVAPFFEFLPKRPLFVAAGLAIGLISAVGLALGRARAVMSSDAS
jgi:hypothetical protein